MAEDQDWVHIVGSLITSNNLVPTVFLDYGSLFGVLQDQISVPCYIPWAFISTHVRLFTANTYHFLPMGFSLPGHMSMFRAKDRLEVSESVSQPMSDGNWVNIYCSFIAPQLE